MPSTGLCMMQQRACLSICMLDFWSARRTTESSTVLGTGHTKQQLASSVCTMGWSAEVQTINLYFTALHPGCRVQGIRCYMMQQLASSVCCRRLSWKLRRSRVDVVASMRKRSRDSNGIWLATWRRMRFKWLDGVHTKTGVALPACGGNIATQTAPGWPPGAACTL